MSKRDEQSKTKSHGGRPRDLQATDRILSAALALGEESGFDTLTVEGIAARTGVGKTTIYRRWPNVWAVAVDAILAEVNRVSPVVERDTARDSLSASMKLVAKSFRGRQGRLIRPLIGRGRRMLRCGRKSTKRWLSPAVCCRVGLSAEESSEANCARISTWMR